MLYSFIYHAPVRCFITYNKELRLISTNWWRHEQKSTMNNWIVNTIEYSLGVCVYVCMLWLYAVVIKQLGNPDTQADVEHIRLLEVCFIYLYIHEGCNTFMSKLIYIFTSKFLSFLSTTTVVNIAWLNSNWVIIYNYAQLLFTCEQNW